MAIRQIVHKPQLTKEEVQAIFARRFEGKYRVESCEDPLSLKSKYRDFQVVKNPVVGVALKLEQTDSGTQFVYGAVPPNRWIRGISFGLAALACWRYGGPLTKEIEDFIDTAPEFK